MLQRFLNRGLLRGTRTTRNRWIAPQNQQHVSIASSADASANSGSFLSTLLQPSHTSIINDEKNMLSNLLGCLKGIDASKDSIELVTDTRSRIDDLFLIVICGEFNAGKSTLINGLIGSELLQSGVLPTTVKIGILRHANDKDTTGVGVWKRADNMLLDEVEEIEIPLQWMKHIAIVDTPGTNAILAKHEELTQKIIPRSDLVLFVTSAERPISESESVVLSKISQWGKKVVLVVNKMDILRTESEKAQVLEFVSQHASKLIGMSKVLPVFGVSGRLALNAKLLSNGNDPAIGAGAKSWEESNFTTLENYLIGVLGQKELIRSKLENPLLVADRVIADALAGLDARLTALEGDIRVLEMIDENMGVFKKDIERDVLYYRQHVKILVDQITKRCEDFLDRNVSVFKPTLLLDAKAFQQEFQREVLLDISKPVDDVIVEMSALISQRARIQARSVMEFVGNRPRKHSESLIGQVNQHPVTNEAQYEASKVELVERIRRDIKVVLMNNDQSKNVERISESVKTTFMQSAAVQAVSAVSVGALLAGHMLDVTGIMAASSAAVMGLLFVPWKKSSVREDFKQKMENMQSQLDTVIANNFERELRGIGEKITDAISPYSRFVETERNKVEESKEKLKEIRLSTREIRKRIE